jgi:hypothetical protein
MQIRCFVQCAHFSQEKKMKVKTNVRAGSGKQNRGGDDAPQVEDPVVPVTPPVSRCVGI